MGSLPFTSKSNWIPPTEQVPPFIHEIIRKDLRVFNRKFKIEKIHSNLTKAEITALESLRANKRIIIKRADKGNAIVVMDRFQYLWEVNRQLADREYYRPIKQSLFPRTIPMVAKIID